VAVLPLAMKALLVVRSLDEAPSSSMGNWTEGEEGLDVNSNFPTR
jgi:hypothetical protein